MKVVIMAGGKGTRIASVKSDVPKPMIPICGKPILEWQIECLRNQGLKDIIIVIGYLGHIIQEYFEDGRKYGVHIKYFFEDNPLGTAGALFKMPELQEDFILVCGDLIMDIDFNRFIDFHKKNKAWASLAVHPNGHPYDSSLIVTEILPPQEPGSNPADTRRIIKWINKEDERSWYKNRVNAGIQIISPMLLTETKKYLVSRHPNSPEKIDLDRDVLKPNISSGKIYAYDTPEYIKDMGTPDRYFEVEQDIKNGIVNARNLKNKQKAIFLDRDGTINRYVGFLTNPEQFELLPGVAEAIKSINKSGYLAIVVTNQPVIARGDCSWEELDKIHLKMETELGKEGTFIDAIYICPHHPDKGFEGERLDYKIKCKCRKPESGMLLKAAHDFNIDMAKSVMIGDSDSDVEAGESAGCRSIKVPQNDGEALYHIINTIIDEDNLLYQS